MLKIKYLSLVTFLFSINNVALAQVIPDSSLPNNSTVINDRNTIFVNDGTQTGQNLFHSFEKFSVKEEEIVIFNNNLDIQNIFSRVTGNSISEINGILGANGIANLFLINSNGIVFGENGAIAIGGSFFATTANKVLFADGFEFKTSLNSPNTILTVTRPVGLGLNNPGQIIVKGTGHQLRVAAESFQIGISPIIPVLGTGESKSGLRTNPDRTIALVGGEITIDGGILTTFSGQIELASIKYGIIGFNQFSEPIDFNYDNVFEFDNILITNQGLLDASGFSRGKISVTGKNLLIQDGGTIFVANFGEADTDSINIDVQESLDLIGVSDFSQFSFEQLNTNTIIKGIFSHSLGAGDGADINISAKDISLKNISSISSLTFGTGDGGNINLQTQNALKLNGFNPFSVFLSSSIATAGASSGKTGNLNINSKNLLVENGAFIFSQPIGIGEGGQIKINVSDLLKVSGFSPVNPQRTEFFSSSIGTTNVFSPKLGDLYITTNNLILDSGGYIVTNTSSSGDASNIFIFANSIEITGKIPSDSQELVLSSQISSSADRPNDFIREVFNLPEIPSGKSGSINISTNDLSISDDGLINVINEGTGDAGNINIDANNINIDNGNISATTLLGQGGNINLTANDINLQNNSNISATAGGQGDGGNISIDSNSLLTTEQSQITADAFQGRGGNIFIDTEVFITSNNSVLTATSQLGIDGVVEINTPQSDLENTIVPIQATILELDPTATQQCLNREGEKELLILRPRDALRLNQNENLERIEQPSLEFLNLSDNLSEEQNKFYNEHLPPNAIIKSDRGIEAVNLCLKNLL